MKLALAFVATFSVGFGARVALESTEGFDDVQAPDLGALQLGPVGGPLVPALVPPPGATFEIVSRETEAGPGERGATAGDHYQWSMLNEGQGWFAAVHGESTDFANLRPVVVRNNQNQPMFTMEMSQHGSVNSWRIKHPDSEQILFTITKDYIGRGWLGSREEWRIYRGRRRDHQQLYYIVADTAARNYQFFPTENSFGNDETPVANARLLGDASIPEIRTQGIDPNTIVVHVNEGEDTALVMSATVAIDLLKELTAYNERVDERIVDRRQQQREFERQQRLNPGRSPLASGVIQAPVGGGTLQVGGPARNPDPRFR